MILNSEVTAEMDRRTKDRHDLRLPCHVARPKTGSAAVSISAAASGKGKGATAGEQPRSATSLAGFVSSSYELTEVESLTENMSRDGMLMHWLDNVPLPELGAALIVEIDLPAGPQFGPRVMKCAATVVRITGRPGTKRSVGLRLDKVRFTKAGKRRLPDLATMPVATDKVN
jgi:hypothetical protein